MVILHAVRRRVVRIFQLFEPLPERRLVKPVSPDVFSTKLVLRVFRFDRQLCGAAKILHGPGLREAGLKQVQNDRDILATLRLAFFPWNGGKEGANAARVRISGQVFQTSLSQLKQWRRSSLPFSGASHAVRQCTERCGPSSGSLPER